MKLVDLFESYPMQIKSTLVEYGGPPLINAKTMYDEIYPHIYHIVKDNMNSMPDIEAKLNKYFSDVATSYNRFSHIRMIVTPWKEMHNILRKVGTDHVIKEKTSTGVQFLYRSDDGTEFISYYSVNYALVEKDYPDIVSFSKRLAIVFVHEYIHFLQHANDTTGLNPVTGFMVAADRMRDFIDAEVHIEDSLQPRTRYLASEDELRAWSSQCAVQLLDHMSIQQARASINSNQRQTYMQLMKLSDAFESYWILCTHGRINLFKEFVRLVNEQLDVIERNDDPINNPPDYTPPPMTKAPGLTGWD